MQTLFKFLPILLALFLAQPIAAQNNYVQLVFYNNGTPSPASTQNYKSSRRAPSRVPLLPVCYFDGESITFLSDAEEFVLPYSIKDENGVEVALGTVIVNSEMLGIIDLSMLPVGNYQFILGLEQNYYAFFEKI